MKKHEFTVVYRKYETGDRAKRIIEPEDLHTEIYEARTRYEALWTYEDQLPFSCDVVAVFRREELELLTHVYYRARHPHATDWMKHIFLQASANAEMYKKLIADPNENDIPFLDIAEWIILQDQKRIEERNEYVYPEYLEEMEWREDMADNARARFEMEARNTDPDSPDVFGEPWACDLGDVETE